ncbi:hypothetical protein D9M72_504400 [compost metagenome]
MGADGIVQRVGIEPRRRARHAHHAQPRQPQDLQEVAVAGRFHQHRIAGTQQRAHHQVQRLRGALRQYHLLRLQRDAVLAQAGGDMLAQRRKAVRMAVARQLRRRHARRGAHGLVQPFLVEPVAGQPAGAGLDGHRVVGEHIRQQPRRVQTRRLPVRCARAPGRGMAVRHGIARARARRQVAQRGQPAVGLGHGEGADVVVLRKAAHRGQGGAGPQRALLDQRGDAGDDLLGQGVAVAAAAGQVQGQHQALGQA